jgi:glycosyltransferase involved in cell wall biosynthesis
MKISIITGIYPPDIGGPATFSKQMLNWLLSKNITSQVLTLSDNKSQINLPNVVFMEKSKFLPVRVLKSIPIIIKNIINSHLICTGLYEEVGISIWVIKKVFRTKHKYVARVVGDPVWERYSNKHFATQMKINEFKLDYTSRLQRKILTWSLNQFNIIICPSEQLKELCENWGVKSEIKVIKNGFETYDMKNGTSEKIYDFVTISRIVSWKNLEYIVEKCIKLNASLLVVGDGPELNKMIKKYQNSKLINFAGRCTAEAVRFKLAQSKNFINASIYEGMSFSTLEAISTGMPIYISDIPGNSQIISDFYVTKLSIENDSEVFNAMQDGLVNQVQKDQKSIVNIELFSKLYSFNSMASNYLELIKN